MRVFRLEHEHYDLGPSAVAIGKFGGLHLGHQGVIKRLRELADQRGLVSVVATFDRHPLSVLAPAHCPQPLVSPRRQTELFEATGVDAVAVLAFTRDFASLTPQEFVTDVLVGQLQAKLVLVGEDFTFGHRGAGTIDTLRELGAKTGIEVVVAPTLRPDDNAPKFSSSTVRDALARGDLDTVEAVLGRHHDVSGFVVHGAKRGRELGFPTANLGPGDDPVTGEHREVEGFVPADGVYAGWLDVYAGDATGAVRRHPAAISVGTNPTFDGVPRTVEAHVIDRDDDDVAHFDLYGHWARVVFVRRLRGMVAYTGLEPLIEQMRQDVDEARDALQRDAASPSATRR